MWQVAGFFGFCFFLGAGIGLAVGFIRTQRLERPRWPNNAWLPPDVERTADARWQDDVRSGYGKYSWTEPPL